jgi:hypothetical protein
MPRHVGALATLGLASGRLFDYAFANCTAEGHLGRDGPWIVVLPSRNRNAVGDAPMRLGPALAVAILLLRGKLFAPHPVGPHARLAVFPEPGFREAVWRELCSGLLGTTGATAQLGWLGGSLCQGLGMSACAILPVALSIALDRREADQREAVL